MARPLGGPRARSRGVTTELVARVDAARPRAGRRRETFRDGAADPMTQHHGRRVRAAVQGRVVRRAVTPPTAPTTHPAPTTSPASADAAVAAGMQHHRAGQLAEAEA